MKSISNNSENEIIINKSRFICILDKIDNEEQFSNLINFYKSKYKGANHYCYSYIIDNIKRFNDDGEPSGTAGMPILNVLENHNLDHILCIVVRYFGGIKLGAGGLVRAYTKAVTECLNNTSYINLINGYKIKITFLYNNIKPIDNILKNSVNKKSFNEVIEYNFNIKEEEFNNTINLLVPYIIDYEVLDKVLVKD